MNRRAFRRNPKRKALSIERPDLVEEWDHKKNWRFFKVTPELSAGSPRRVWWKCKEGHEWMAQVKVRAKPKGTGCPRCAGKHSTPLYRKTRLVREWGPKNTTKPADYTTGSSVRVWWRCVRRGHEWVARINARVAGSNCPYCSRSPSMRLERLRPQRNRRTRGPRRLKRRSNPNYCQYCFCDSCLLF